MNEQRHQEIRSAIRDIILNQLLRGAPPSVLTDDLSLERSHLIDSAKTADLLLILEESFGITVENEDAVPENFDSVNTLVAYIARKTGAAS